MVNYEIYRYNPEVGGYGEWENGDSIMRGTTTMRAMKINAKRLLNEGAKTGLYVVAVLEGTANEFEGDYWTYLKYDVIVDFDRDANTLKIREDL